jgi:hypothetical protein
MQRLGKIVPIVIGAALLAALTGCFPEAPTSSAGAAFEVVGVAVDGLDQVPRNQEIQVVLSQPIEPTSVNDETIQLLSGPDFLVPVPAKFDVRGRSVTIVYDSDMPTGLRPSTDYQVLVPGFPKFHTVLSANGMGVSRGFRGYFRTSSDLRSDIEPPTLWSDVVPVSIHSLSDIVVEFSEAMDPRTTHGENLVLRTELGERVAGRFVPSANLRKFFFVPEHEGFPGTFLTLTVRSGVTDLAGNYLHGSYVLTFLLDREQEMDAPSVDLSDPVLTQRARSIEVSATGVRPRIEAVEELNRRFDGTPPPVPVGPGRGPTWIEGEARRVQMLFTPEEVGGAGEIHRLYFETGERPDSPTYFTHTEIRLWETDREELSGAFHENYPLDLEQPVGLQRSPYLEIAERGLFPFFTVPLRKPFLFDGERNLIVEIVHFGGSAEIPSQGLERPGRLCRLVGSPFDLYGQTEEIVDDIRFGLVRPDRWVQQVPFVDRGRADGTPVRPIVLGNVPFIDDFVLVECEGADLVGADGRAIGPTTGFEWRAGRLPDARSVRCRIHILRDLVDGQIVEVERIRFGR